MDPWVRHRSKLGSSNNSHLPRFLTWPRDRYDRVVRVCRQLLSNPSGRQRVEGGHQPDTRAGAARRTIGAKARGLTTEASRSYVIDMASGLLGKYPSSPCPLFPRGHLLAPGEHVAPKVVL